jgi:hypothetical protein
MGTFRQKLLHAKEQFGSVDDMKLKMTLIGLADRYSYQVREMIRRAYEDPELILLYRGWRNLYAFDKGGKVHKEIIRFPNGHVYDFVNTVLTALYGSDWMQNKKALKHELVRPWWIRKMSA